MFPSELLPCGVLVHLEGSFSSGDESWEMFVDDVLPSRNGMMRCRRLSRAGLVWWVSDGGAAIGWSRPVSSAVRSEVVDLFCVLSVVGVFFDRRRLGRLCESRAGSGSWELGAGAETSTATWHCWQHLVPILIHA